MTRGFMFATTWPENAVRLTSVGRQKHRDDADRMPFKQSRSRGRTGPPASNNQNGGIANA
jgi:hypothetical protein